MRWVTLMLTGVLVLPAAASLARECAWVVWTKREYRSLGTQPPEFSTDWELIDAFTSKKQCITLKTSVWAAHVEQYNDLSKYPDIEKVEKVLGNQIIVRYKKNLGSQTVTVFCLPDTIDPREKE